jgi:23S rRNA pseudouridine1911/1915/1917 synthase
LSGRLAFVAAATEAGERLDVVLAARSGRSRTAAAAWIRGGRVTVNGVAAKAAHVLGGGDRIVATIPPAVAPDARPEPIPLEIVYEDADLAVIDKPAGMATHPAPGSASGTLVNALLAALGPLPAINGVLRPGIVHRLDKDTSGLIVVAKSERAMRSLSLAIARRTVAREYDAVVWGRPPSDEGTIDAPIARDRGVRTRFAVAAGGRRAVTHYRVLERYTVGDASARRERDREALRLSLLALRLDTGRTHQIRVHCAAIGAPIVGDATYGAGRPRLGVTRQMLHAARLAFDHPVTGEPLRFVSAWPEDFAALVERLRAGRAS